MVLTQSLLNYCSPGQESQQIFKARFPIDTETIKTKVCMQSLFVQVYVKL